MKTTALFLVSAAVIANADGAIHVQYDRSECYGHNDDPAPGPKVMGANGYEHHTCQQEWCPNRINTDFCLLRDMKDKEVGIVQFEDTVSYKKKHHNDKSAHVHISSAGTWFFHKQKSAIAMEYPFISDTGNDLYNDGHFSVNTLSGSGLFEGIGTHGALAVKATGGHRVVAIKLPEKATYGMWFGGMYGAHGHQIKGSSDQHIKSDRYGDQHIKGDSYGDQHTKYGDGYSGGKRGFAAEQTGSCRGVDGGTSVDRFQVFEVSVEECRKICLGDPKCTGIEHKPPLGCEVHTAPIASVFVKSCYVKSPSHHSSGRNVILVKNQGSCRGLDGGKGVYQEFEVSVEECRKMCLGDPKCTAIEDKSNVCEVHTAPIGFFQTSICQLLATKADSYGDRPASYGDDQHNKGGYGGEEDYSKHITTDCYGDYC